MELRAAITLSSSVFESLGSDTTYYVSTEDVVSDVFYRGIIIEPYPTLSIGRVSKSRIDVELGSLVLANDPFDPDHPFSGPRYSELIFEVRIIDVSLQYGENTPFWSGTMYLSGLNADSLEFRLIEDSYTDLLLRYSHQVGTRTTVSSISAGVSSTTVTLSDRPFTRGQIITFEELSGGATVLNYSSDLDNYYIVDIPDGLNADQISLLKPDGLTNVTSTDITDSESYTADSGFCAVPVFVPFPFGDITERTPVIVKTIDTVVNPGLTVSPVSGESETELKDNGVLIGTTDTTSTEEFFSIDASTISKGVALDLTNLSPSVSSGTVTLEFSPTAHGLSNQSQIRVKNSVLNSGTTTTAANGTFSVTVNSSTSVSYAITNTEATAFTTAPNKIIQKASLGAYGELSYSGLSSNGQTIGDFASFVSNRLLGTTTIDDTRADTSTALPVVRISSGGIVSETLNVSDLESPLQRSVTVEIPIFVGNDFTVDTDNGGELIVTGNGVVTVLQGTAPPGSEVFASSQTFQPSNINSLSLYQTAQTSVIEYAADILDRANHDFHIRPESDGTKKLYLINRARLPTNPAYSFTRDDLMEFTLTPSDPLKTVTSEWTHKVAVGEDGSTIAPPALFDESRTASVDVLRSGKDQSIQAIVESIVDMTDHLSNYAVISLRPTAEIKVDGIYDSLYFGDAVRASSEEMFVSALIMVRGIVYDFFEKTTVISGDVALLTNLRQT